jgi:hypothetical protein
MPTKVGTWPNFSGSRYSRNSKMRLAGTGAADQHGVALLGEECAGRQVADQRLVDRRTGKVEIVDILGQRQLGDGQLVFDRARLLFGDLGGEQVADDARRLMAALDAVAHHLVVGRAHAVQLQRRHQLEHVGAFHQEARRRLS